MSKVQEMDLNECAQMFVAKIGSILLAEENSALLKGSAPLHVDFNSTELMQMAAILQRVADGGLFQNNRVRIEEVKDDEGMAEPAMSDVLLEISQLFERKLSEQMPDAHSVFPLDTAVKFEIPALVAFTIGDNLNNAAKMISEMEAGRTA